MDSTQKKYTGRFVQKQTMENDPTKWAPLTEAEKRAVQHWDFSMIEAKAKMLFIERGGPTSVGPQRISNVVHEARELNQMIQKWVDSYGERNGQRLAVLGFYDHWKQIRVWTSLQFRLATEQVLWEKGEPWRRLVSGFRPLE